MITSKAIFVLILNFYFIFGFVLNTHRYKDNLWFADYSDNGKMIDNETMSKPVTGCNTKFCDTQPVENQEDGSLLLTPLLESGEIDKAKNLSAVDPSIFAGVTSHAAYFTVNITNKWHLFFWYFPAENLPLETTPLIIWLQGGPGSSSLFGLFEEIGPIQITDGKVERRNITWGGNYSLIFIDNPVGTGFSFTEDPLQYVTNEDMVGECLLNFLQQFLQVFPELRQAPLFLTGESYAGKYIPAFGHYIHKNKDDAMPINLKGLAIGNGWTDPPTMLHYSEWALQLGLIDQEQAKEIHKFEVGARECWEKKNKTCFRMKSQAASGMLDYYAPVSSYNYLKDSNYELDTDFVNFLNKPTIQDSLHVKKMQYSMMDYKVYFSLFYTDAYETVKPWLEELLEHYGVMCYSGQLDVIVAYALSVHTYRSLKWSGQQGYLNASRQPIVDDNNTEKANSFIKASGNFMDVMVRNAGHMVPTDQPRAAKQIIDMFIKKFK